MTMDIYLLLERQKQLVQNSLGKLSLCVRIVDTSGDPEALNRAFDILCGDLEILKDLADEARRQHKREKQNDPF
jgi:hypothetical protein